MEDKSGVTRSIIHDIHSWDMERDHIDGESGVSRSIIDELHSWDIQEIQVKMKVVLLEV